MNECIPVAELGTLEQLREDDPKRRHAAACPRCSSLLFAYEEFNRAHERPNANVNDAEARLERFIAEHVEATPQERISGTPRPSRGRWFDFSLFKMSAAVAAVLIVAVVLVRFQPWESKPIVYRGEPSAQFTGLAASRAADGNIDVHWNAVKDADAYRVTILGEDLAEIMQMDPTSKLSARFTAGTSAYYWQVTALQEGAEILTSDPQRVPE
jgi:hypothetical protein